MDAGDIGASLGSAVVAGVAAWQAWKANQASNEAATASAQAEQNSRSVSNGFTDRTAKALEEIKDLVIDFRADNEHQHAGLHDRVNLVDGRVSEVDKRITRIHGPMAEGDPYV
jgi:predicted negative regulator of RcsB-dependent stress response